MKEMASGSGGTVIRYVGLMWSLSYGKCAPGPCFLVVFISTYTQKKKQKGSIHDKSKSFPGHMTEVIIMHLINVFYVCIYYHIFLTGPNDMENTLLKSQTTMQVQKNTTHNTKE